MFRKIAASVVVLLALFFWWMTVSVPMFEATTPAIIAIALSITAYFVWPKKRRATI